MPTTEHDTERLLAEGAPATPGPSLSDFRDNPGGWAVFLDVDGTLIDIAPTPNSVAVPPSLPDDLVKLERITGGALALVTGRGIDFVDQLFAPHRFAIAGLHGAERRESDGQTIRAPEDPAFPTVKAALRQWVAPVTDVGFEDKGAAVALHYRQAPLAADTVAHFMDKALAMAGPAYSLQLGKMVIELRPRADKGEALTHFMQGKAFKGRRPIVFGDDATDESMFETVNELGGLSVKIGDDACSTKATSRLISPEYVRELIKAAIA
jgi:trehalose 6-phosphate phosphatase